MAEEHLLRKKSQSLPKAMNSSWSQISTTRFFAMPSINSMQGFLKWKQKYAFKLKTENVFIRHISSVVVLYRRVCLFFIMEKSLDLELKKCSFSYYFIWGYFIVFMIVENFLFRVINLFVWTLCLFLYYHLDIPIEFWGMNFPRTCCSLSAPKCIFVPIFGICIPFTTGIHQNTC